MSEKNEEASAVMKDAGQPDGLAKPEQSELFDRLRSGDDPEHEEARTELVELANELLNILAFPIDTAAAAYVARTLLDDSKLKLWPGERHDVPGRAGKTYEEVFGNLVTDTDVRMHMVGDTGVMNFYHVLDVMARLLVLAGRGDRVMAQEQEAQA
jgi:hypothetical protein